MEKCAKIAPLLLVLFAAGCGSSGPQHAALKGSVSYNNEPVTQGAITFIPMPGSTGTSARGEIVDGEYSIPASKGPTYGKYRVEILWTKKTGKQIERGSPAPPGTMVDEVVEAIPAKYNTQSTLEREVTSPEHDFDFKLDQ